jgi:hypothetical protein
VLGALNTIDGYEAMHMIREGQVCWLARAMYSVNVPSFTACLASLPETRQRAATPLPATSPLFATDPYVLLSVGLLNGVPETLGSGPR